MRSASVCLVAVVCFAAFPAYPLAIIDARVVAGDPLGTDSEFVVEVTVADSTSAVATYATQFEVADAIAFVTATDGGDGFGADPIDPRKEGKRILVIGTNDASTIRDGVFYRLTVRTIGNPGPHQMFLRKFGAFPLFGSNGRFIPSNLDLDASSVVLTFGEVTATPTPTRTRTRTPTVTPTPTDTLVATPTPRDGDLQGDGAVDARDLLFFSRLWERDATTETAFRADLVPDGRIDAQDLVRFIVLPAETTFRL